MPKLLNNPWVLYGGAGAAALVALLYLTSRSSATTVEEAPSPGMEAIYSPMPLSVGGSDLGSSSVSGTNYDALSNAQLAQTNATRDIELARIGAFERTQMGAFDVEKLEIKETQSTDRISNLLRSNRISGAGGLLADLDGTKVNIIKTTSSDRDNRSALDAAERIGQFTPRPSVPLATATRRSTLRERFFR